MSQLKMNILQIGSNADPTKNFIIKTPAAPDGSLEIRRGNYDAPGALVAVINADGTIGVQAGAKFPAAQVASTDVNTLDDYEEGAWTPVLTFGGASVGVTYTAQVGRYVKVGKVVHVFGEIALSNKGSSAGAAQISGLPFPANTAGGYVPYSAAQVRADALTGTAGGVQGLFIASATPAINIECTNTGSTLTLQNTNFLNNSVLMFTATYEAAQ